MEQYLIYFLQSLLLLILTPFFMGFLKRFKAFIRGYSGSPLLQTYYDLTKLVKKHRVISKTSSFITSLGPSLCLAATITTAFIIPVFYVGKSNIVGDMFIVIFLLAIVKFFSVLMGMDCASTFGGMGSSRELFISMLAEPVMFVSITFIYIQTKTFNIYEIAFTNSMISKYSVAYIIAAIGFFILLLAENTRMPIDNPETHLELTMVHEGMILDLSGRDLAFVELAAYIKFMVFITIFINCFLPFGIAKEVSVVALLLAAGLYIFKLLLCLIVIAIIETTIAKFRLFRIPEIMAAALSISLAAVVVNYFT